ncbi:unnamed protein product [Blepharisma stoltei]|uniref:Uncharacterized protein n=1 Tax=Blepharisma stoltei TaxID=1481888 RepID=A0AAU9IAN9_9CILI|nr:unnamed protein product [Blepharisma stoltei]
MIASAVKAAGLTTLLFGTVIGGNYYYVQDDWKKNHALVKETITLLEKDAKVQKILGKSLARKGSIQGTLEPDKTWASAAFIVYGSEGEAKAHILAEAKESCDSDEFPVKETAHPSSTFGHIINIFNPAFSNKSTFSWKITSLHVKFDEVSNYPLIHDKLRSHKEMRELKEIELSPETTLELEIKPLSYKDKIQKRKAERSKNIMWRMLTVGGACLVIGGIGYLIGRKYFKILPVANSVFFGSTLQSLKYDPVIQREIGIPMNFLQNVKGRTDSKYTKGNAEFTVYGPKGYGKIFAQGDFDANKLTWKYTKLALMKGDKEYSMLKD